MNAAIQKRKKKSTIKASVTGFPSPLGPAVSQGFEERRGRSEWWAAAKGGLLSNSNVRVQSSEDSRTQEDCH